MRCLIVLVALALLASPAAGQDAADQAWRAGDRARADTLYSARLATDSADQTALHRVALLRAWAERYDEAIHLLDRLLAIAPENLEAQVDRARFTAWRGDARAGIALLDPVIAANPTYLPALQARAQFASWAGAYDAALADYGRLQALAPTDAAHAYDRARVLAWASRFPAAEAAYDSLLRANPSDVQALLGLAQVLTWSSRLDSAEVVYGRVLQVAPADVEARRGLARAAAWSGRLVTAEARWREILVRTPDDAAALVGLSQTLRWQGREAAAYQAARRAASVAPADRDVREALRWARVPIAPRTGPVVTYESDSDGNRITTLASWASFRPSPAIEVRGGGYYRGAGLAGADPSRSGYGVELAASTQVGLGWNLTAGVGGAGSDADAGETRPTWRGSVASPGRNRVVGGIGVLHTVLDGTALLIERQVTMDELAANLRWSLSPSWSLFGSGGFASYQGHVSGEDNRRWSAGFAATRRIPRYFTVSASARSFGFERDLTDGYFDPDFYGIAELVAGFNRTWGAMTLGIEAAPGVQQVRSDGDPSGSARGSISLTRSFGPGRSLSVTGIASNSGLNRLGTGDADYRYRAVTAALTWSF